MRPCDEGNNNWIFTSKPSFPPFEHRITKIYSLLSRSSPIVYLPRTEESEGLQTFLLPIVRRIAP